MRRLLAPLVLFLLLLLATPAWAQSGMLSIYTPAGTSFTVPGGVKVVKPQAVKEG